MKFVQTCLHTSERVGDSIRGRSRSARLELQYAGDVTCVIDAADNLEHAFVLPDVLTEARLFRSDRFPFCHQNARPSEEPTTCSLSFTSVA